MLVSHRHQFIYTKTHKTASTSVEAYFERFCFPPGEYNLQHQRPAYESEYGIIGFRGHMYRTEEPKWWNHMPASQIKSQIGDDIWNQYFKFCVIRNPYDRVVSFFFWEMRQDGKPDWELFTLPQSQLQGRFENWLINAQIPDDRNKYMINGTICMDDFIRYEDLPSDVEKVCRKLSIDFNSGLLPAFKREYRPLHATAKALHTKKTKEFVETRYTFELEYFGYEFPANGAVQASAGFDANATAAGQTTPPSKALKESKDSPRSVGYENLVRQIYQGVLGREADSGGLDHYSKVVAEPGGVSACLQSMISSSEFADRVRPLKKDIGFRKEDLEQEKVVFLHLPKTGGTTLHQLLLQGRTTEEICPERHNGLHAFAAGELARYRVFSGHFDYASTQLIPGCKAMITMLRNPVDRLVSLYHFQKAHREEVIERDGLYLARLANSHSMADFFRLDEIHNHPSIHNAMTRMLSERQQHIRWEHEAHGAPRAGMPNLETAFQSLQDMRAFGFVEHYEQSVAWIFESLGLAAPDVIPRNMAIDTIVKTDPGLKEIHKEPLTREVRDLVQELVQLDTELYDRAMEIFPK